TNSPATPQTSIATPTFPPPRAAPKLRRTNHACFLIPSSDYIFYTKFSDLLAFSGPAPKRINGRLAMIGFVAAMGVEIARGTDMASLIPLSQGVSVESRSYGLMSSSAEMWNGRAAMLGLVSLVLTEVAKGGALI
ncbi:hypothetical protein MKW94_014353, partial [Papaver nudicaule]|nr:hypothetical protein [Papaver nudicaule]